MSSGSSTAGSNAYSSDLEESKFLQRNRLIHWGRLILSLLTTAIAIAIVACEAVPFRHYMTTADWAKASLALWPQNLDLRPTITALSCGCVIAFINLIYIAAALLPSPRSRIKLLNICSCASALAGFITALTGVLFTLYLPSSTYPTGFTKNETIHSWTCRWKTNAGIVTPPSKFARDCHILHAGFALLCTVLGLEVLMGIVAAVGFWIQRDVGRRREEQVQLEKLEIATKQAYKYQEP